MQARILFLTDLHKRDTDFTTIQGYTKAIDAVQDDILSFVARNEVTGIVIGGDWYDKGYRNINRTFNDINYDRALAESVNGNIFLCRGNHLFLERDANPEMYIIQPCEAMPLLHPIHVPDKPLFQCPDVIQVGPLQISLFHFSKEKRYTTQRNPQTTFHIGVFHDDCMLPTSIRTASGDHGFTTSADLEHYFGNLDLAICNHIHTAVGQLSIPLRDRKVPTFIPGSLCITKNQASELHSSVQLPVVTLNDDDTVKVSVAKFSLHTELLKLYNKKETEALDKEHPVLKQLKSNKEIAEALTVKNNSTLKEILIKKGYNADLLRMVDEAAEGTLSAATTLSYSRRAHDT